MGKTTLGYTDKKIAEKATKRGISSEVYIQGLLEKRAERSFRKAERKRKARLAKNKKTEKAVATVQEFFPDAEVISDYTMEISRKAFENSSELG